MKSVKAIFIKIAAITISALLFYRVVTATDVKITILAFFFTTIFTGFTVYILFEKKIKKTYLVTRLTSSKGYKTVTGNPKVYNYNYNFNLLTTSIFTLACYFSLSILAYSVFKQNHPFLLWWFSKIMFYLCFILMLVASCYFTIQFVRSLKSLKKGKENKDT